MCIVMHFIGVTYLGYVSVEMEQYTVSEAQLSVTVCWLLFPPELSLEREVLFTINTQSQSATELDFGEIVADTVMLSPATPTRLCVDVAISEDRVIEDQELFLVVLESADSAIHFNPNSNFTQVG